jgi:hypothetical protein
MAAGGYSLYTENVVASMWVPILAGVVVFFGLVLTAAAVGGFVLWRFARRKWRAFHSHGAVVGAMALWEVFASRRRGGVPASADNVNRWTPRRVRREMWRSVDQAGAAVRAADEAGAPTADLPSLCRRLQAAAMDLDKVLRVEMLGPVPVEVSSQTRDIMQVASDVQRAAVVSASDATGQRVRDLTRDADHEIRLLDAGLASAQAALPPHSR